MRSGGAPGAANRRPLDSSPVLTDLHRGRRGEEIKAPGGGSRGLVALARLLLLPRSPRRRLARPARGRQAGRQAWGARGRKGAARRGCKAKERRRRRLQFIAANGRLRGAGSGRSLPKEPPSPRAGGKAPAAPATARIPGFEAAWGAAESSPVALRSP